MAKARVSGGHNPGHIVMCPACKMGHRFDSRWTFNGDLEKPTFRASMLVNWFRADNPNYTIDDVGPDGKVPGKDIICHSFVTDGKIEFLSDCTHEMKGQTVDLPDF